jgi:hypothetical protein
VIAEDELRTLRHDLRGRLNAMTLCAHFLLIASEPGELLECLDGIEGGADQVNALLDRLDAMAIPEHQEAP